MMRKRKGQGILEYVLILTAIVGVIIVVAVNVMPKSVRKTMNGAAETIDYASDKWVEKTTGQ